MSSSSDVPVYAAILAGGRSERMGGAEPKQLLELGGLPLLSHSLLAFERSPHITGIILVSHIDHLEAARDVARAADITKLTAVVPGGATRSDSSRAAIAAASIERGLILIHDAARPLISAETIGAVVGALEGHRAAAPATPASDTIIEAHGGELTAIPDRRTLWHVQTPQGFELATIREAYRLAAEDPTFAASDDCGVVHRYLPDVGIKLVPGSARNIKITHSEDLRVAESLLR